MHIAQFNVAKMIAPLTDPLMRDFVEALESINALADSSPGFFWRLQDDGGDATSIQAYEDETVLVNMSVWTSLEALKDFVYRSRHLHFLRNKKNWFAASRSSNLVLWWIDPGDIPTIDEGKRRLDILIKQGPYPEAFNFSSAFAPPADR